MQRAPILNAPTWLADILIFVFIGVVIYCLSVFGQQWQASFNPTFDIDLSPWSLPMYSAFSALRGLIAYAISLGFTLVVGYWAAKSEGAEKIILPFLDIMQSIPVLGFLPGLVLGLVAIFPKTNTGLELAAILMIFTGQVWNMAFSFYSSLKSVPMDLREAAAIMELSPRQRLVSLELPFSAVNLTWNSIMSMAGGWFFLTVCEAFTLGKQNYRLPGLGAYMAVAMEKGDSRAIVLGILAMALVIIVLDILIWRPALAFVHRFRLEETADASAQETLVNFTIQESTIVRFFNSIFARWRKTRKKTSAPIRIRQFAINLKSLQALFRSVAFRYLMLALAISAGLWASYNLLQSLLQLTAATWFEILTFTFYTLIRVIGALIIATIWATPAGIWLSQSSKRMRIAQPIVQLMASFPAPMLYPLAMAVFLFLHINFEISAMLLMLLGVQWYVLFNVLAGGLRIPQELKLALDLIGASKKDRWRYLYLPSVFPALVTGWVTAAGGAWNASIVSELITYKGDNLSAKGLGSLISQAASEGNFPKLAACLIVMVIVVVLINRTVWAKAYRMAQTRYRLDLA